MLRRRGLWEKLSRRVRAAAAGRGRAGAGPGPGRGRGGAGGSRVPEAPLAPSLRRRCCRRDPAPALPHRACRDSGKCRAGTGRSPSPRICPFRCFLDVTLSHPELTGAPGPAVEGEPQGLCLTEMVTWQQGKVARGSRSRLRTLRHRQLLPKIVGSC